ncbi:hypothetical protein ABPG72_020833 [Tetrahymena utriculariae]
MNNKETYLNMEIESNQYSEEASSLKREKAQDLDDIPEKKMIDLFCLKFKGSKSLKKVTKIIYEKDKMLKNIPLVIYHNDDLSKCIINSNKNEKKTQEIINTIKYASILFSISQETKSLHEHAQYQLRIQSILLIFMRKSRLFNYRIYHFKDRFVSGFGQEFFISN